MRERARRAEQYAGRGRTRGYDVNTFTGQLVAERLAEMENERLRRGGADVSAGRLKILLPQWRSADTPVHALYQRNPR